MKRVFLLIFSVLILITAKASDNITITIVYDNYIFEEGTTSDWGFSCFIEGAEKTILFDAGYNGHILLQNCDRLGIDLEDLDAIVISHYHADHYGGLDSVLGRKTGIPVYIGNSCPESFSTNILDNGATPIRVTESVEICKNIYSTGELQGVVNEQSLVINTEDGLVVITGCSHPGIVNILTTVKEIFNKDIYLAFGGFHLEGQSESDVDQIIQSFTDLDLEKCGATHCTGESAIAQFEEAFGNDYVQMGVGKEIQCLESTTTGINDVMDGFLLYQNYPNSFSSSTTIPYSIKTPAVVKLKVVDLGGQEVETIVNTYHTAGEYDIVWQPEGLTSGIYFYTLQIDKFTETRKFIFQK